MKLRLGLASRVIGTVAGAAALAAAMTTVGTLPIIGNLVADAQRRELQGYLSGFQADLRKETERAAAMATVVAALPDVQRAMAAQDRDALARTFLDGFGALRAAQDVEQFQFHLPPATSFFRVHQPQKSGDDLSSFRKMVVEANRTQKPMVGIEAGVAGLGVRGVIPVRQGERHLGTIEFGTNFGQAFFDRFKREHGVDVGLRLVSGNEVRTFAETLKGVRAFDDAAVRDVVAGSGAAPAARSLDAGDRSLSVMAAPVRDFSGQPIGVVEIAIDSSEYVGALKAARRLALGIAAGALLVAGAVGYLMVRSLCRRLVGLTAAMARLAGGETEVQIPGSGEGGEVGAMARAVEVFKSNAAENRRLRDEQEAARGQAEAERRAALHALAEGFEQQVGAVITAVASDAARMEAVATSMSAATRQTNEQTMTVAAAAQQASLNVQTVASATEELSASIGEISQQVRRSTEIASSAVVEVRRTSDTVDGLAAAAQKIGEVFTLIQAIAGQTNLLALNATIEAARAGEHGKGFAVVASEVKSLANQTAKATEDIAAQIGTVQSATGEAVTAMRRIGSTIGAINETATAIAAAVEQQGAATREIASSVGHVAHGADAVSGTIAEVRNASAQTGEAAEQVLRTAGSLAQQSGRLEQRVQSFLGGIRAA